ncbi:hypothetical protein H5410_053882 [Solanum commersonii]|uniref:Uncharacterized protein n=1 Tax=Solanum commersonii TaxID=4109 RepID=A0A9J5X671_SOLCO|nr:hypothetical protein H5410_053882 [Solanum commersonii]
MYQNKQFWDCKHFKEKLSLRFRAQTSPESPVAHSQFKTILTLLQKMQDNFSFISTQLDNIHISTSSISNITSLSPTITQEVAVEDAIDSATTRVREEIASALIRSWETNIQAMQTRCLMKVLTRLKDSVHEFDMAFDLVKDNSMGLQMPLQER